MKHLISLVTLIWLLGSGPVNSQEQKNPPRKTKSTVLGIKFGDTYRQVSKKVTLKKAKAEGKFKTYTTKKMPKGLSDAELYILIFHKNIFVKAIVIGGAIQNDAYGTEGEAIYDKYKTLLGKKYTLSNSFEWMGRELYTQPSEFWECLRYKAGVCGMYASYFEGEDRTVSLSLEAVRGGGYYKLGYESHLFVAAVKKYQDEKETSDEEGL